MDSTLAPNNTGTMNKDGNRVKKRKNCLHHSEVVLIYKTHWKSDLIVEMGSQGLLCSVIKNPFFRLKKNINYIQWGPLKVE